MYKIMIINYKIKKYYKHKKINTKIMLILIKTNKQKQLMMLLKIKETRNKIKPRVNKYLTNKQKTNCKIINQIKQSILKSIKCHLRMNFKIKTPRVKKMKI